VKGNPSIDLDWYETKNKVTGETARYTVATGVPPKPASATI